jgi:hypothetical protein
MKQMSLLKAPEQPDAALAWPALNEHEKAEVVATLARLIARMIVVQEDTVVRNDEGATDE